jgi:hypothetical protein
MLNPLSIQFNQFISGKDINDWCRYQIENQGSHFKDACRLIEQEYKDDRLYRKAYKQKTASTDKDVIIFIRCL